MLLVQLLLGSLALLTLACSPAGDTSQGRTPSTSKSSRESSKVLNPVAVDATGQGGVMIDTKGKEAPLDPAFRFKSGPNKFVSRSISFGAGVSGTLSGFVLRPAGELRPGPAILALPGRLGLNDPFKRMLQWFVAAGFTVLAIDLYEGKVPESLEDGQMAEEDLLKRGDIDVMSTIKQGADFLFEQMSARAIAVSGWDTGGRWALLASILASDRFVVGVSYDGNPNLLGEYLNEIRRPLLIYNTHEDPTIDIKAVIALESTLESRKLPVKVRKIQDATSGFMEPARNPLFFDALPAAFDDDKTSKLPHVAAFLETVQWLRPQLSNSAVPATQSEN